MYSKMFATNEYATCQERPRRLLTPGGRGNPKYRSFCNALLLPRFSIAIILLIIISMGGEDNFYPTVHRLVTINEHGRTAIIQLLLQTKFSVAEIGWHLPETVHSVDDQNEISVCYLEI